MVVALVLPYLFQRAPALPHRLFSLVLSPVYIRADSADGSSTGTPIPREAVKRLLLLTARAGFYDFHALLLTQSAVSNKMQATTATHTSTQMPVAKMRP